MAADLGDLGGMRILRHYLTLLLMVMMFPWGAYMAGPPAQAAVVAVQAQQDLPAATRIPHHKRCRTATLPGSQCGFLALLPDDRVTPTRPGAPLPRPDLTWAATGHLPAVPQGPPRPV